MATVALPDLVGRVRLDTTDLDRATGRLESTLGKIGAAVGAAFALKKVKDFGLAGLGAAANFEQVEIAFTGILGSGQKAQAFLEELRDFAAKTPFELPGLTTATQQLLGVGFATDQVLPTLGKIGNLTSALGVGTDAIDRTVRALGQIKGRGKVASQELIQISEAVPGFSAIGAIAEGLGITTAEAFKRVEDGAISGDEGIALILKGMEKFPGAAGAMDRQSKTLNGRLSTFKDTIRNASIDLLDRFLPAIGGAVKSFTELVAPVSAFIAKNPVPFFAALGVVVGALAIALGAAAASAIAAALPFIAITTAIAALVGGVIYAYQNFETFRNIVDSVVTFMVGKFNEVKGFVLDVWPAISEAIGHAINVAADIIRATLENIKALWSVFGDDILRVVSGIFTVIRTIVETVINVIAGIIRTVLAVINGDWGKAWNAFKGTVDSAIRGVQGAIEGLLNVLRGLVGGFFDAATRLGGAILEGIGKGISGAVGLVTDIGKAVANGIIGFVNSNVIDKINRSLEFRIDVLGQGVDINPPDIARIPKFHSGGIVQGSPGQDVLALLKAGERVIPVGGTGSGGQTITVNAQTNANPWEIAREVAWLRKVSP